MDFIEQEAECSDSDSSISSTDEQGEDLESFIDDQEYDDDESSPFTNVVRPLDEDSQQRLYNSRWTAETLTILKKISIELKDLKRPSSVFQSSMRKDLTYFFRLS